LPPNLKHLHDGVPAAGKHKVADIEKVHLGSSLLFTTDHEFYTFFDGMRVHKSSGHHNGETAEHIADPFLASTRVHHNFDNTTEQQAHDKMYDHFQWRQLARKSPLLTIVSDHLRTTMLTELM
jgi:hypothetical protein